MKEYAYCGLDCSNCEYKERCNCGGCTKTKGNPFYGKCRLAECTISHNVEHCGFCQLFPCNLLKEFSYDKENGENGGRIKTLLELIKTKV